MLIRGSDITWQRFLLVVVGCVAGATGVSAQTATWTGATSNQWGTATNWSGTAPTTGSTQGFVFGAAGAANTINNNDLAGLTATAITFNGNSPSYELTGIGINLGGSSVGLANQGGNNVIGLDLALTGTQQVSVTGGSLTINGNISGPGFALIKNGPGTLTLTGQSSYSGGTFISGGTVLANNTSGSATGSGQVLVSSGSTLGGNGAISGGGVTVGSGARLTRPWT
jgi:autotransporter-associated beta strand protein